jgi:hypothetical protein
MGVVFRPFYWMVIYDLSQVCAWSKKSLKEPIISGYAIGA